MSHQIRIFFFEHRIQDNKSFRRKLNVIQPEESRVTSV